MHLIEITITQPYGSVQQAMGYTSQELAEGIVAGGIKSKEIKNVINKKFRHTFLWKKFFKVFDKYNNMLHNLFPS